MDINYSYFNTAKGYKVVGGTAAQFLKADGSVDSNAYLPLSGGTMTGAVNLNGIPSYIRRDMSTWTNGTSGFARDTLQLYGNNGVVDTMAWYGTVDSTGNVTMVYGYLGGTSYATKSAIRWNTTGQVLIGGSGSTAPNVNYGLEIIGNTKAGNNLDVVGNINSSSGELTIQRLGVNRFRTSSTLSVISAETAAGQIYLRPAGDASAAGQVIFSGNNTAQYPNAYNMLLGSQTTVGSALFHTGVSSTVSGYGLWMGQNLQWDGTNFIQPRGTLGSYAFTVNNNKGFSYNYAIASGTDGSVVSLTELAKLDNSGGFLSNQLILNDNSKSIVRIGVGTNAERVHNKVYNGSFITSQTGILSFTMTPPSAAATMFDITIKMYSYAGNVFGELRFSFYRQNATSIHASAGVAGSIWCSENFITDVVNVGFDAAGKMVVNIGDPTTIWLNYLSYEIERIETKHTGGNQDWANGWTSSVITDVTGFSLVNIPLQRVATRTWVTSQISANDTKYPLRALSTADANSIRASDTRNTNPLPSTDLKFGTWFDFKTTSAIGLSGTGVGLYAGVMTMAPYSDNSGNINSAFRLGQSAGEMYFQNYSAAGTWGTWNKILHTGNMASVLSGYITTNTTQTGLTGDKSTTGIWTFGAPIEINKGTARISGNSYGAINTRMHPTDYSFWGNQTGALVIILPSELQYQNNIEIDIIDNQSNNLIQKLQVNAYEFISYSKASLVNDTGSPDVVNRVRIGKLADNRSCIIINDINTAWSYPQMIVKKYVGGSLSIAKGTWTTQVMTDLSSVTIQQELTITKAVNSATLINKVSAVNSTYGLEWDGLQTYLRRNNDLEGHLFHSGNLNPANFAAANHTHTFASLTSKPTTLSGFGIADGMSTNHVANGITSAQINNWTDAYAFANNFAVNNPDLTAIEALSATDGYLRKDGNGQWSLTQATYTLPVASSSVFGGVKLINDTIQTAALDSPSSIAKRTYGVQMNPSKQMVVNVPWVNTTYSNGTGINLVGTQFSANFGTAAGTIAQGNDPRIVNAIKLNTQFTINTGSGLVLSDDYMGGESGIYDETYNMLLVGKENGLHKFGASYGGSGGVIVNPQSRHMGYGGVDPTDSHNHYFNGTIRITKGIYSESSNGNDLYAGSGDFYHLDEEIAQEDKVIRLAPFDKVFSGTNNTFATKNRVVKITLNDGGAIMMDEFFVNQEITIMNVSGDYATFIVNNTSIKVKIDPRSSATFYVNSENKMVMVRMDNDYCRILG